MANENTPMRMGLILALLAVPLPGCCGTSIAFERGGKKRHVVVQRGVGRHLPAATEHFPHPFVHVVPAGVADQVRQPAPPRAGPADGHGFVQAVGV